MRAAIYTRFSTDKQDATMSPAAQIENCMMLAKREGFTVADKHIFGDEALSGAKIDRPGYLALKKAIKRKEIDVILANETSRLTRVTSELVALGELLQQQRPNKMHLVTCDGIDTRADGWEWLLLIKAGVDSQERRKIGFRTYGALRQRHGSGKSAGGKAYGYTHKPDGDYRVKAVVPSEAKIVKRIFTMFADGMSHRAIAKALNAEAIPSPGAKWNRSDRSENSKRRDGKWMGSTIYAMLRNELYRGESIWNRAEFYLYTDPDTGKTTRKSNPRPPEDWLRHHDEKLRIIPEDLWDRCQKRIKQTSSHATRQKSRADRRRLRLFDLACTECDARYVMVNWKQLGCSTNRNGGETACSNRERINIAEANQVLLDALCNHKDGLLSDATLKEVRKHMTVHMQKLKREAAKETGAAQRLREQIDENARQQENVIDLVAAHGRTAALDKKLKALEQERKTVEAKLATTKAGKLENLPDVISGKLLDYRAKVAALADGSHGLGAHQFAKAKALIAEILGGPVPVDANGVARLDLARMVVAGAGFEPATFGL